MDDDRISERPPARTDDRGDRPSAERSQADAPIVGRLHTAVAVVRAAFDDHDFARASVLGHRYQALLLEHLRVRIADDHTSVRPISCREGELMLELVQRTRSMVMAAIAGDAKGASLAETVVGLTDRYLLEHRLESLAERPFRR